MTKEDARSLIKGGLSKQINYTTEDVKKLAKTLQYFPLALKQAIAYINDQEERAKVFGQPYKIEKYFNAFKDEKEKLLNYEFADDFSKCDKATFVTLSLALDAIAVVDKTNGPYAIKAIQIIAYLYADKIDSTMLLSLFESDLTKIEDALLLLDKYSMITKIDPTSSFYQVHRLVQDVVQIKFKKNEKDNLLQAITIINPELLDKYFKHINLFYNHIESCTIDQYNHYNTVSSHLQKYDTIRMKYSEFFQIIHNRVLINAALKDDKDKIIALNVPRHDLIKFIEKNIQQMINHRSNQVIKYFIENNLLELNYRIFNLNRSLIESAIYAQNLDLFKFLIDKNANPSKIFVHATVKLIFEIKSGSLLSLQTKIDSQSNSKLLEESLFYATLFNQKSIVDVLRQNNVKSSFVLLGMSPIRVAANLSYENILEILLEDSEIEKKELKKILFQLAYDKYFNSKHIFEMIFDRYRALGGHIDDKYDGDSSFLSCVSSTIYDFHLKLELVYFLLDSGADLILANSFLQIFKETLNENYGDILLNKICDNLTTKLVPEKFIDVIVKGIFKIDRCTQLDQSKRLFESLLKKIGDINVRNVNGETVLINYLKNDSCKTDNVKFLVENGVDVDAIDKDGRSALYYYFMENNNKKKILAIDEVFKYLINKVKSTDEYFLHEVISEDKYSTIKLLFDKKVLKRDLKFSNDKTLVEIAVEHDAPNTVLFLKEEFEAFVKRNRNVNEDRQNGRNLLVKYVQQPRFTLEIDLVQDKSELDVLHNFKFLFESCIKLVVVNKTHDVLSYAVTVKDPQIFQYLLDKFLKKNFKINEKVLSTAIDCNKASIVEDLISKYFSKRSNFASKMKRYLQMAKQSDANDVQKVLENWMQ